MYKRSGLENRWSILLCLVVLAIVTALIAGPRFWPQAEGAKQKGLSQRGSSYDESLPNYDIRTEKGNEIVEYFERARTAIGKNAVAVADIRDGFVRGEEELRSRIPTVKVEYNSDIRTPEVITPDLWKAKIQWLSLASSEKRSEILRSFVKENNDLVGVTNEQADALTVLADYTNPDGNLSFAHLEQRPNGIPVFRSEVKAGFTKDGRIIRVINNLAPGLDYGSLSTDFRDPLDAVKAAAKYINHELKPTETVLNEKASNGLKSVFGRGDWATTAEKMYFPTEPGVAVPAWRVLIWQPVNAFYIIVDAETGTMLWRKNITSDQNQTATYQVYNNTNAYTKAADSPAPLSPYVSVPPNDPTVGAQGSLLTRSNVSLIGNEGPLSFNVNGWMTDGINATEGNNTIAGVDRVAPNGVDATQLGDTGCPGAGCRVFTSTWNPPGPGNPGDDPLTPQAQRGAVIQMFYVVNRWHDELYLSGFTEAAGNFQQTNFTGMGLGNDRVSSEGQDSSSTNNANFSTTSDGTQPRMQMFLWTGPTPDRDGTGDADIIIHELSHGTSGRLHGNGLGLGNQGAMMGEGWGDWYAHTMLAEPTDSPLGVYGLGGHSLFGTSGFTGNYYYGIRRMPTAVIASTGGALNKPHNPMTFGYLNTGCDALIAANGAFARNPVFGASGSCAGTAAAPHNGGEIWKIALWEVRGLFLARRGFTDGTRAVLQVVTDGMKLSPISPTMLQGRDAIIAAAAAISFAPEASADVADVREGFRRRGMGFSASVQSTTAVTEAFDAPNAIITNPMSVGDSTGDNDGFPEPGENVLVSVPITNSSGATINNVVGNVTGGGSANYGNIADGATVTRQIAYTVPSGATCGSQHTVNITGTSASGTLTPRTFTFTLGVPVGGAPVTVTGGAIANPGSGSTGVAAPYPSTVNVAGLSGNKKITLELTNLNTTYPGDMDWMLVGPGGQKFVFMSDAVASFSTQTNATIVFKDSAAAGLPTGALANMTGEWRPTNHGAGDAFAAPAPAGPYSEAAPAGAATFASVFGTDGTTMNGNWSLYGVDDVSGDVATIAGWKLTFEANDYACAVTAADVEVSGRVLATVDGRGLRGARVVLRDESGNETYAYTGAYGTFRFPAVETGHTYILSVMSRRFQYAPQVLQVNDNVTDLVFSPQ